MIRLGAIGGGMVFGRYYAAAKQLPELSIVAMADPDPVRRAYWASLGCHAMETTEELLNNELDAILVLTPNHAHYSAVTACINSGKDVLCEKPLTVTVDQARRLFTLASDRGVILYAAMHVRHRAEIRYLLQRCAGEVAEFDQEWLENWTKAPAWYRDRRLSGGGVLLDIGINQIDWMQTVAGTLCPGKATARVTEDGIDELCNIRWRFKGGTGQTELSWRATAERRQTVVRTHRGSVFRLNHSAGTIEDNGRTHGPWEHDEYAGVLREFIAVLGGIAVTNGTDSLQLLELIRDVYALLGLPYLSEQTERSKV